jgi:hypothetical protein
VPVYIINFCMREASNPVSSLPGPTVVALHPFATDVDPLHGFTVRVGRPAPAHLVLDYELHADLAQVRFPEVPPGAPVGPTDGLWRHTCLEVFVGHPAPGPYLEFNFAPSGQWAAYRFSGYRAGMAPLTGIRPPRIEVRTRPDQLLLSADLELPRDVAAGRLRLAVTAVVESAEGVLAYWAQRHAPGRPDFHHPHSFALEI